MNIDKNVNLFVEGNREDDGRVPDGRYSSFDYCFNYFQSFRENNKIQDIASSKNIQTSCLQLGFYLASWGMLRGSSFLLKRSTKFYIPLIQYIAEVRPLVWDIDVPKYTEGNIALLIDCRNGIKRHWVAKIILATLSLLK